MPSTSHAQCSGTKKAQSCELLIKDFNAYKKRQGFTKKYKAYPRSLDRSKSSQLSVHTEQFQISDFRDRDQRPRPGGVCDSESDSDSDRS